VAREEDEVVATLWEEARKALRNQEWTDRMGLVRFRLVEYERELDPMTGVATTESRRSFRWTGQNPIRSRPAGELHDEGSVRSDGRGGFEYYAPDAAALLSDTFVEAHCFGLTASPDAPGLIGLSFEPLPQRRGSRDIEGTVWLSREDARLQTIEFTYTWAPWSEAMGVAGGRVEFEELPEGAWVIRRWWIRMPRMTQHLNLMARGGSGLRIAGIVEVGGTAERVDPLRRSGAGRHARIQGLVWDSTRAGPLAGAEVYVRDGGPSTVADSTGRFTLEGVPVGSLELSFRHPRLDSIPVAPPVASVSVTPEGGPELTLAVPSLPTLIGALCRSAGMPPGSTAVVGVVTASGDGAPVSGATVALEWTDNRVAGGRMLLADVQTVEVTTGERGRYVACGIPPDVLLAARARRSHLESATRRAEVPGRDLLVWNLTLTPEATSNEAEAPAPCPAAGRATTLGSVVGRVREAGTDVPIGPSRIWLATDDQEVASAMSDAGGRFAFCAVRPGAYVVRTAVRGLGSAMASLVVVAGDATDAELRLLPEDAGPGAVVLRGRVVRAEDGRPLAGAEVRLSDGAVRITASDGSFAFDQRAPGRYTVGASFLGYADSEGEVMLAGGGSMGIEIRIGIQPIELDAIVVEAVRFSSGGVLGDVRRRATSAFGTVLMGEELATRLRTARSLTWVLQEHGATVEANGRFLRFSRTDCAPHVYIDGAKVTHLSRGGGPREAKPPVLRQETPEEEAARAVDLVHPAMIAAVEIYRGPAQTPGEFLDSDARCGVILIWTRRGDDVGRDMPGLPQSPPDAA
jgi:hypothetical protein